MKRLDLLLFEKGLVKSREKARALIMEGVVSVNGTPVTKAGAMCAEDAELLIREDTVPFVSRGGLKLEKAVRTFPITLEHAAAADIGASTGGFTDCMLQHGASHVYAIDVGYGQLDWKLRTDERVSVMERTNARYMEPSWFEGPLDFASIDVDNTSAFCYRTVTGSSTNLSNHAYGLAIDLNPLENPYVRYDGDGYGVCAHDNAQAYVNNRSSASMPHVIDHEDLAYQIFADHGFTWGGDWNNPKDYQHFQKELY